MKLPGKNIPELARLFLKLGFIGFGGPAAHIAMMRSEVVEKRKWMSDQEFLDLVGATSLIPGPNSTEMAIHLGKVRGGWPGLFIAGACFILPAVLITGIFAWLYKEYGHLPDVYPFIYGIPPALIAIILAAVFPMAATFRKKPFFLFIGVLVFGLTFFELNVLLLLFGAGFIGLLKYLVSQRSHAAFAFPVFIFSAAPKILTGSVNLKMFLIFLKIGSILYGSGYVLFAFLEEDLVNTGLLSHQQLVDAIAVGQFTPGPVFSAVTFIGYQVSGITGAVVSTFAIFLPSFIFVALLSLLIKKVKKSGALRNFLDGVNISSVALVFSVCYGMAGNVQSDPRLVLIAVITAIVAFSFPRINSALLVLGGSVAGYLLYPV